MPTAHTGELQASVKAARFGQLYAANPGFPFINAGLDYESINFGLRKGATFTAEPVVNPDIAGRDILEVFDCRVKAETKQTTFAYLKNLWTLAQNPHNLLAECQDADLYLKFLTSAGTFATPTATQRVGCDWTYTIDTKERLMSMDWHTHLTDKELDLLYSGAGTTSTGETGGTSLSLTSTAYDWTAFQRSGIQKVMINGVDVGIHEGGGAKVTIKSLARHRDKRQRAFNREVEVEAEVVMLQTAIADLQATVTDATQEYTVVYHDWNDCTITLTASASTMPYPEIGDGVSRVRLVSKGTYTNAGVTMATTALTFAMRGYS